MFIIINIILSIVLVPLFTSCWKDKQNRWGAFILSVLGLTPFLGVPIMWLVTRFTKNTL